MFIVICWIFSRTALCTTMNTNYQMCSEAARIEMMNQCHMIMVNSQNVECLAQNSTEALSAFNDCQVTFCLSDILQRLFT